MGLLMGLLIGLLIGLCFAFEILCFVFLAAFCLSFIFCDKNLFRCCSMLFNDLLIFLGDCIMCLPSSKSSIQDGRFDCLGRSIDDDDDDDGTSLDADERDDERSLCCCVDCSFVPPIQD